jgi:hypothetical protein
LGFLKGIAIIPTTVIEINVIKVSLLLFMKLDVSTDALLSICIYVTFYYAFYLVPSYIHRILGFHFIYNITDILNWTTNITNSEAVCIGYEGQYDNHGRSGLLYYVGDESVVKGNNIHHTS